METCHEIIHNSNELQKVLTDTCCLKCVAVARELLQFLYFIFTFLTEICVQLKFHLDHLQHQGTTICSGVYPNQ